MSAKKPSSGSAAGEKGNGAGAVVGSVGAVDARGAPELGHDGDHRLAPGLAHVGLDRGQCAVERSQQVGELTGTRALVDVRVPANKADRPDTRAIRLGEEASRCAGSLGEKGAHARDAGSGKRCTLRHRSIRCSGGSKRRQPYPRVQRGRQSRIGVMI